MLLVLLVAAAVGWWGWRTREAQALRFGDVAAVVAALVAFQMFTHGRGFTGLLALGGAGAWLWFRREQDRRLEAGMSRDEARRLLDVPAGASAQEIRAAHRRLIARVHPDTGGSADLTARVNAARDTLLARRRPI